MMFVRFTKYRLIIALIIVGFTFTYTVLLYQLLPKTEQHENQHRTQVKPQDKHIKRQAREETPQHAKPATTNDEGTHGQHQQQESYRKQVLSQLGVHFWRIGAPVERVSDLPHPRQLARAQDFLAGVIRIMVSQDREQQLFSAEERRLIHGDAAYQWSGESHHEFWRRISSRHLYGTSQQDEDILLRLLHDLATQPIISIAQKSGGTQLKLLVKFKNGGHALLKPMRYARGQTTLSNQFYFTEFERHTAEIAAFHLDRILGFRRAVPVTGRKMNITAEIMPLAPLDLLRSFFISPDNNVCFHGNCSYYCDTTHAICGRPDMLEVSAAAYLPPQSVLSRSSVQSPWRRSYHKRLLAPWQTDDKFCEVARRAQVLVQGGLRLLLDMVDLCVLDFLAGNQDRHHVEMFNIKCSPVNTDNSKQCDIFPLHIDNGRGFGRSWHHDRSILAPLKQCCLIRLKTVENLYSLSVSSRPLSERMRNSMIADSVSPVLLSDQLVALDIRLNIVLLAVYECLQKAPRIDDVIIVEPN